MYSLSYVFIICQYIIMQIMEILEKCCGCLKECCDICCKNKERNVRENSSPVRNVYISNSNNNNNGINIRTTTSRNEINTNRNNGTTRVGVQVAITNTNNRILLLSNVLPREVYENLKSFIQQGKEKMIKLISFYLEMSFDGLTAEDSISREIASIIVGVARILSEVFNDRIASICLELGSDDHIMLLMHYAFPFIISVIKLKIEKGIYRRTINVAHVNVIQSLTQVQRRIELDEQGNIRISFRINRQINQNSFIGLLNP